VAPYTRYRSDGAALVTLGSGGVGSSTWGGITGTLGLQLDLQAALDAKSNNGHGHAAADISDSTAAGRAMLVAADVAAQTALLNAFTSALKGLVPPSAGGTVNFLRADGSWVPPAASAWGSLTGTLSAQTDLQNALNAKATVLAPVTISTSRALTSADCNRTVYVDTAGVTLTINNDASGGYTSDDALDIQAVGSGSFTLVQGTATLTTDSGASAASATAVGKRVQAQRLVAADNWRTVSSAIVTGTGNTRSLADAATYTIVDDTNNNTVASLVLGNLAAGTCIDVTMIVEAVSGVASNGTFRFDINNTEVAMLAMPETSAQTGRVYRFTLVVKSATVITGSWDLLIDNTFATDPYDTDTVSDVTVGATLRLRSVRSSTGKVIRVQLLNALVRMP
jgi:hypothetical protein